MKILDISNNKSKPIIKSKKNTKPSKNVSKTVPLFNACIVHDSSCHPYS